jgi:hypothetical protein
MTWLSGYDGYQNNYPVRYRYPAQKKRFSNRYSTINQVYPESNERDNDNGRERAGVVHNYDYRYSALNYNFGCQRNTDEYHHPESNGQM